MTMLKIPAAGVYYICARGSMLIKGYTILLKDPRQAAVIFIEPCA